MNIKRGLLLLCWVGLGLPLVAQTDHVPGELIISLKPVQARQSLQGTQRASTVDQLKQTFNIKDVKKITPPSPKMQAQGRLSLIPQNELYVLSFNEKENMKDQAKAVAQHPDVVYAEPNYYVYALSND